MEVRFIHATLLFIVGLSCGLTFYKTHLNQCESNGQLPHAGSGVAIRNSNQLDKMKIDMLHRNEQVKAGGEQLQTKKNTANCSHHLFRSYYNRTNYFPSGGHWVEGDGYNPAVYLPSVCHFRFPRITHNFFLQCLQRMDIRRITIIGDSQARHYFISLQAYAKAVFKHEISSKSNIASDHNKIKLDKCSSCEDVVAQYYNDDRSKILLTIERVHLVSLATQLKDKTQHIKKLGQTTSSYVEYLFQFYFKHKKSPDILFILPPFNHDKKSKNISYVKQRLNYLHQIIKDVFLQTIIQWMPAFAEFEEKKAREWKYVKYDGMLGTGMIDMLNHYLFGIIKESILNNSGMAYGTYDLLEASKTRQAWTRDGIHLADTWYEAVMSNILELICSE